MSTLTFGLKHSRYDRRGWSQSGELMPRQPTMADIARRAGVSRVAVSYALNGRPGVSDEVRRRIVRIAQEIGFSASGPARALHGAAARAVGLTMRRPSTA